MSSILIIIKKIKSNLQILHVIFFVNLKKKKKYIYI